MTFANLIYNDSMHEKVTVLATDILNAGVGIIFQNALLPITLSWDKNVFYSDSIPYTDQDPAPRAQGELWFDLPLVVDGCYCRQRFLRTSILCRRTIIVFCPVA